MRPGPAEAALAAAASLVLAACVPVAAPPPSVRGVAVRLLQYRSDIAPHRVQLEVVNGSPSSLVVTRARLVGSRYRAAPSWSDRTPAEIPAGATVDLPAAVGTATCGSTPRPRAELTLAAEGRTATVVVPVADSHATLAALHDGDCFAQRAARVARIVFRSIAPAGGRTAAITLDVRPGRDAATGLEIVRVLPTTLLSPTRSRTEWDLGRRTGTGRGTIVLEAVPTRCDLHAIAEDKLGSVLPALLRLSDGSSGLVQVVAPPDVKNAVTRWVSDTCATGR